MKTRRSGWGRALLITFAVLAVPVAGVYAWWHWKFPYGHRTCFMPCMLNSLQVYAWDHEGAFPAGTNSYRALQKLFPEYLPVADNFAGVSGNIRAARRIVSSSGTLTSNESSWVYIPGLSLNDDPALVILYERARGISGNGARSSGHAAGFLGGDIRQIPDAEWEVFLAEQAKLRARLKKSP
jgi:hypothetical protein